MLLIGIDEAGYGPLLGPLVVAGSAFRVGRAADDAGADAETGTGTGIGTGIGIGIGIGTGPAARALDADAAGAIIRGALTGRGRGPARLLVDDSKKVYSRGGLTALERAPLALAGTGTPHAPPGLRPSTSALESFDAFLRAVGVDPAPRRDVAWYAGEPPRFPLCHAVPELEADGAAAHERLAHVHSAFLGCVADVIPESRLNAEFARSENKAETLFHVSLALVDRLRALARPGEAVVVVLDRHGGRKRYGPHLQGHHADGFVWTLRESDDVSTYRVDRPGGGYIAHFRVGADAQVPPVALASMLAKYLREVFMGLWNDWFATLCPDVRPTAGYAQDGRRWLDESRPVRLAAGVPDARLARTR